MRQKRALRDVTNIATQQSTPDKAAAKAILTKNSQTKGASFEKQPKNRVAKKTNKSLDEAPTLRGEGESQGLKNESKTRPPTLPGKHRNAVPRLNLPMDDEVRTMTAVTLTT